LATAWDTKNAKTPARLETEKSLSLLEELSKLECKGLAEPKPKVKLKLRDPDPNDALVMIITRNPRNSLN
jgi:hypothetical protein